MFVVEIIITYYKQKRLVLLIRLEMLQHENKPKIKQEFWNIKRERKIEISNIDKLKLNFFLT